MKYRARHRGPVIDRLKVAKLIEAGLSNLAIADAMGCAPNTVPQIKRDLGYSVKHYVSAGRAKQPADEVYRRKLESDRARSKRRYVRHRVGRAETAPSVQAQLDLVVPPKTPVARESETLSEQRPSWDGKFIRLADIGNGQCRFPTGGGEGASLALCGAPVSGGWCCGTHAERAFVKRAAA